MKYKAVIFDAGGVLHAETDILVTEYLKRELGATDSQCGEIWRQDVPLLSTGVIDETKFWNNVTNRYGLREVKPEEDLLGKAFVNVYCRHTKLYATIQRLKDHGVVTAVLSNTIKPHADAIRAAGGYAPFDQLFLSYELKCRKPNRPIYETALQNLGFQAEKIIFVDDAEVNVRAAEKLGMRGLVFHDEQRAVGELEALCLPVQRGNAEILLSNSEGHLLMQHRDDKPGISNPGDLTAFGGHIEPGETPVEAAKRETEEETNLRVELNELIYFGFYRKTKAAHGEDWDVWFFQVKNVDEAALKVFEGQGFKVVKNIKQAKKEKTSILIQQVLPDYFDKSVN